MEIIDHRPVQKIHHKVEFNIEYYDNAKAEVKGEEEPGRTHTHHSFIRPFNLFKAPLLRVGLMEIGTTKHLLLVDMHHIISDGVSIHLSVPLIYHKLPI